MDPRIQHLLDTGRLVQQPAPDPQVAGLWRDGMGAYEFASSPDRPPGQRLIAVHDTARMAALALLRAASLRERAKGDRETTFAAAGFLGRDELSELLGEIRDLRSDRNQAISAEDVWEVIPTVREILVQVRERIVALRPAVASDLAPIPEMSS